MNQNETTGKQICGFEQAKSSFPSMPAQRRQRWPGGDLKRQPRCYKRRSKVRETDRAHPGGQSDIGKSNSGPVSGAKCNSRKYMMEERWRVRRLKVKRLLLSGADVDCRDQDGCLPMMLAVQCRHYDTAKRLPEKAADLNATNRSGDTLLTLYTRRGSNRNAGLERGADVSSKTNQQTEFSDFMKNIVEQTSGVSLDNTIVQQTSCVSLGNTFVQKTSGVSLDNTIVQQTFRMSLDINIAQQTSAVSLDNTIDFHKGCNDTNIDIAGGSHEPADFLGGTSNAAGSAELNENSTQSWQLAPSTLQGECYPRQELDSWARTVGSLHLAASEDDKALMQLLVELGADVNGVYREQTPMMAAVTCGAVDLLIRQGADVNAVVTTSEGGRTALLHALSPQYISAVKTKVVADNVFGELDRIVRSLVQGGASLTATDAAGNTPVMATCEIAGAEAVLGFLSGAGVGAQLTNAGGESVLHLAARSNSLENFRVLSQHCRVEVDLGNRMGATALMIAAMNKNRGIIEHLIRLGASVNQQDNGGNTSLMYAVRSCSSDTEHIRVLLEAGANPNIKNETGFCPLTLAAADLSDQVLRVFLEPRFGLEAESKEKALHLLLAGNLLTAKVRSCAKILLEHNTRSYRVNPSVIHKFIADGHAELVEKLIRNGTPPSDVKQDDPMILGYCWPVASASPLCAALLANQHALARRIAELWYLTQSDFKLSINHQLKEYLLRNRYNECLDLLQDLACHTISLRVLSFTAVSAAIGNGSQRTDKIEKLQVPEIVKNMLLFKKPQEKTTPNFVKLN